MTFLCIDIQGNNVIVNEFMLIKCDTLRLLREVAIF